MKPVVTLELEPESFIQMLDFDGDYSSFTDFLKRGDVLYVVDSGEGKAYAVVIHWPMQMTLERTK